MLRSLDIHHVETQTIGAIESYCTFMVDGNLFGIKVDQVQEAIRFQRVTQVPLASSAIHGLMNLRGQIVSVLSLRELMGVTATQMPEQQMNVVVCAADGLISLLVDEIGDVISVACADRQGLPSTLGSQIYNLIHHVYPLDDRLLLVLDAEQVARLTT